MLTLQKHFDQNESKDRIKIFIEGSKIGKTEGNTLVIEDFKQLESIYISELPNLSKLTIKDCEELSSLEIFLDNHIEVVLIGKFPKLSNFKTTNTQPRPVIVEDLGCKCGKIRLFFEAIIILLNIILLAYIFWEKRKQSKNKK